MRLKDSDIKKIFNEIEKWTAGHEFKLYLFGSRVNDKDRGGDIDLLLLVPKTILSGQKRSKGSLIVQLHKAIGERKIDIVIDSNPPENEFTKQILSKAIEINHPC